MMKNNDKTRPHGNAGMAKKINLQEIKAETILSLENVADLSVQTIEKSGTFYRNYSPDLIDYNHDDGTVTLSRDSVCNLLPEGLFFEEDELKNSENFKETNERIKERKKQIGNFFQPFDTEYFKLSLALEKKINKFSEKSNELLINLFFDKEKILKSEIPHLQFLLPQISHIKGNEHLIINVLKTILGVEKIELIKRNEDWKRFIIHIPNLLKEEYTQKTEQVSTLFEMLKEYFLPFHVNYDFKVKDRQQKFVLGENLILDYNTNII